MRSIKIACTASKYASFESLLEFQGKLKKLSDANYEKLKKSILKHGFSAPIFVWKHDGKNNILDGHQRLKVIKKLNEEGYKIPPLPIDYIIADNEKEAKRKLLAITSSYGEIDVQGLDEFLEEAGIEVVDILEDVNLPMIDFKDMVESKDVEKEDNIPIIKDILDTEQILKLLLEYENIFFAFSGGKDSMLALLQILPIAKKIKKHYEVLYVETGTEIPDIGYFVVEQCRRLHAKLTVLKPKKIFFEIYAKKRKFPDPISKPCMHLLIADTINRYVLSYKKPILICGGRANQKRKDIGKKSRTLMNKIINNKELTILNPNYHVSKTDYDKEVKKATLWPGYQKGFLRTACWCCPFQKPEQYIALKKYYPLLWQIVKKMSIDWEYPNHPGDGHRKRFLEYFQKSEGIDDIDIM